MDRQEKKLKEINENGSENGSNEDTDNEDKVSSNFNDHKLVKEYISNMNHIKNLNIVCA